MRKSSIKFCEDEIPWFNREDWVLLAEILDTLDKRRGCVFLILGSIQSWKSLVAQLKLTSDMVLRPARYAWYGPNRDFVRQFAEEKLNDLYANTPILRKIEPAEKDRIKTLSKNLPHMLFSMLSAHTKGDRQSKTIPKMVCDEAWMYDPGELTEIRGRYTSFEATEDWQMIVPSSGETKGDEVNELWEDSDQRTHHLLCPDCEEWFYPDVYPPPTVESINEATGKSQLEQPPGGLMYDAGPDSRDASGRIVQRLFNETVYYECPNPACRSRHKDLPLGSARFVSLRPVPAARNVVAWKWNALAHMPLASVALLKAKAEEALKHGDAFELEDFDRKRAVRPWSVASVVKTAARPPCAGNYDLGESWGDESCRFLFIDVQIDHYYWLVRAFSKTTQSRLVAVGVSYSEEQLREVQTKWACVGHGGRIVEHETGQLYFETGCGVYIDGNYETARVRKLAARNHWCVLRGEASGDRYPHADGRARIWNPIQATEAFSGVAETPADNADRYVAEVRFRKNAARDTLRILQNQKTPFDVWTYARNVDALHPDYLKHLAAWAPRDKLKSRESLETVTEWRQVEKRDDWEWCECSGMIAAAMSGLIGSDAVEKVNLESTMYECN